ncbi:MAG: class I SAM-dependent methyltransferase [Planctomycetes bacterium]|nr:class I SAM-dependent methyltransferase [Planctomycetota bacterium]
MARGAHLQVDWYDEPHAYDIVFAEDTRAEGRFLVEMLRVHGPKPKRGGQRRALEPACGSGRLVCELARRGLSVVGFDLNDAMLDYARSKLRARKLRARLEHADMTNFRFEGRFDLVHCLVSTFKYLLDEASARAHLECVARALRPGGIYVVGLHLSDYSRATASQERWIARRNGTLVTCVTRVEPAQRKSRLERVRTRLTIERGGKIARTETRWNFRTYDARQFARLVASVPEFECVALHDFHYEADVPRSLDDARADCVYVLRKRARALSPERRLFRASARS